jgi:hypothetical protein
MGHVGSSGGERHIEAGWGHPYARHQAVRISKRSAVVVRRLRIRHVAQLYRQSLDLTSRTPAAPQAPLNAMLRRSKILYKTPAAAVASWRHRAAVGAKSARNVSRRHRCGGRHAPRSSARSREHANTSQWRPSPQYAGAGARSSERQRSSGKLHANRKLPRAC